MEIKRLESEYKPPRPWARAIIAGDFVFLSGVAGIDPDTYEIVEGLEAQLEMACKRIKATLEAAGTSFDNVIKTTIYMTDVNLDVYYKVFYKYFKKPTCETIVEVKGLARKGMLVELDVTAVLP